MERPFSTLAIVLVALALISSCGPAKLSPILAGNNQYNTLWIGWLDLGEQHYESIGYGSRDEWQDEIKQQNESLQGFVRRKMGGWTVNGANAKTDEIPKDTGTILIIFKDTVFDIRSPVDGVISSNAEFIDAVSKKVLLSLDQKELGATIDRSIRLSNLSFGGKLNNAMYNIAYDIHYYLTR